MLQRFAVTDGIHLTADVLGEPGSSAVILMHGGGQTRHSWHAASTELARQGYYVINYDARGHGDSDWSPQGEYSLEIFAADLMDIIQTLPQPPALVGASMGAATALFAVGNSPTHLVRALVLVDFVPEVEREGSERIRSFMNANLGGFATVEEAADAVSAYYPHRRRPRNISGLMKNLRRRDDGRLYWHWDPRFVTQRERGEPPQFSSKLSDAASRIQVPALLVRGLLSDIISERGVASLKTQMPALELYDVAGAAHMVAGDKNDKFNQGVIGFLQRQMPARPAP